MEEANWLGLHEDRFNDIYLKYYESLCYFAMSYTNDRDHAEDLVQEVLLYLWQNRNTIKINTSLKSYLYRAVYNKFIDEYRKTKSQNAFLEQLRFETTQEAIDNIMDEVNSSKILKAKKIVESLPPKCQKIFLMSKIQNLTYNEIAEELDISVKTVEAQMGIAFKKIREFLGQNLTSLMIYILSNVL
ncbi:RNA polymerase sigma-70 factor [Aegicerativicinus sediminis]|uniref:RNA polymerase sigma-70 factor n=1 Tax=Aegicerativicinus sediminis TaxID=2893202 RepID=UPI001E363363|nr:RNA polymerase sigma-70 factor [Aegicerativicinus sediminis]